MNEARFRCRDCGETVASSLGCRCHHWVKRWLIFSLFFCCENKSKRSASDPSGPWPSFGVYFLSRVETARFFAFWQNAIFTVQNWFYQWREGALDEAFRTNWSRIMTDIYQAPGFRAFWEQRKYFFAEEFTNYCETEMFSKQSPPGYRPLGAPQE